MQLKTELTDDYSKLRPTLISGAEPHYPDLTPIGANRQRCLLTPPPQTDNCKEEQECPVSQQ